MSHDWMKTLELGGYLLCQLALIALTLTLSLGMKISISLCKISKSW